jgi:hypothetical protein
MQLQEELRPFVAQQVFVQGSETINVELKRQPTGLCCSENFIAGNSDAMSCDCSTYIIQTVTKGAAV